MSTSGEPGIRFSSLRIAGPVFLAACLCTFVFFWLGSIFVSSPHAESIPLRLPTWDEAKWWLGRPDTGYYIDIAEHGYTAAPFSQGLSANWAFFPAYPLLLRLIAHGRSPEFYLAAGFSLSLIFYGCALCYLTSLLRIDYDPDTVTRAIVLFCFFPFAYFLAVFGPDSLYLLTACASLYYARREHWIIAALFAAAGCLVRVQGVLVIPCLVLLYLKQKDFRWTKFDHRLGALLLTPAGLIAFAWHLWRLTGNPLAFMDIQQRWNNQPAWPFSFLIRFLRAPVLIGSSGWDPELLSVVAVCAMAVVLVWSWRKRLIRPEYSLFFALQLFVLVSRASTMGNLRYAVSCFPFTLALGIMARRPMLFGILLAVFGGFFGLFAALFAAGQQHNPGYHFAAF